MKQMKQIRPASTACLVRVFAYKYSHKFKKKDTFKTTVLLIKYSGKFLCLMLMVRGFLAMIEADVILHHVSVVYTIGYFLLLSGSEKLKISESIFKYFRRAQKRRLMSWRKQADMLGEVQKSGGVRKWP